jgi:hypothetical protein
LKLLTKSRASRWRVWISPPNSDVWRLIQRIVSRINPKVQEVDLDQLIVNSAVRNLEESGFMPEMRKKFAQ